MTINDLKNFKVKLDRENVPKEIQKMLIIAYLSEEVSQQEIYNIAKKA